MLAYGPFETCLGSPPTPASPGRPALAGHSSHTLRPKGLMQMSQTSLDKSKIKFLLLEGVHQNAVDTLKAAGYSNIEYIKTALTGDEL